MRSVRKHRPGLPPPPHSLLLDSLPHQPTPRIVSIIGLVVYLVGVVGTTVWYSREHYHAPEEAMAWRWKGVPHFFGVAVYALEVNECCEGNGGG